MLLALVLASWWAQAEPAPVEAAPAAPASVTEPPTPVRVFDNRLAVTVGYGARLGDEAARLGPRNGFAVSAGHEHRFVPLPRGFDFGAGVEFDYHKFATTVTGTVMPTSGQTQTYSGDRLLSYATILGTASLSWRWSPIRPYFQVGAGVSIAYFNTPEMALSPGNLTTDQPVARVAGGMDIAITPEIAVTMRLAYTHPFTHPTLTTDASSGAPATYSFLGDLFDAGAGVALGF